MGMLLLLVVLLFILLALLFLRFFSTPEINNFADCAAAGNLIMEIYPERCQTRDGRTFIKIYEGDEFTVEGTSICLPHKNTEGPQTLECAFGLMTEYGNFALEDSGSRFTELYETGKKFTVTGILKNPSPASIYNTVGTLVVTYVTTTK